MFTFDLKKFDIASCLYLHISPDIRNISKTFKSMRGSRASFERAAK